MNTALLPAWCGHSVSGARMTEELHTQLRLHPFPRQALCRSWMGILVFDGILANCEHYPAGAYKSHRGLSDPFRPALERRRGVLCPVTDRPLALPSLHHPGQSGDGPLA